MEINLSPDFIIEHVSIYLGTCTRAVLSPARHGLICDARQISMYFSYKFHGGGYRHLGEWFNRSEWDVRHHVETCIGYMKVDKEFAKKIKMVERHLINMQIDKLSTETENMLCTC